MRSTSRSTAMSNPKPLTFKKWRFSIRPTSTRWSGPSTGGGIQNHANTVIHRPGGASLPRPAQCKVAARERRGRSSARERGERLERGNGLRTLFHPLLAERRRRDLVAIDGRVEHVGT